MKVIMVMILILVFIPLISAQLGVGSEEVDDWNVVMTDPETTTTTSITDTNATSICSGTQVLFGNGSCGIINGSGGTGDFSFTDFQASYNLNLTNIFDQELNTTMNVSFNTLNLSGWGDGNVLSNHYDLAIGDGGDFGAIEMGGMDMLITDLTVGSLDLNGTLILRNKFGGAAPEIEYAFATTNNLIRLAIPRGDEQLATYNPRSFMIGGVLGQSFATGLVNCTSQGYNHIDCDTVGTGADLGIQDDLEIQGRLFLGNGSNINSTDDGNLTANFYFGDGSQLTGISTGNIFDQDLNTTNEVNFTGLIIDGDGNITADLYVEDDLFVTDALIILEGGRIGVNRSNPTVPVHINGDVNIGESGDDYSLFVRGEYQITSGGQGDIFVLRSSDQISLMQMRETGALQAVFSMRDKNNNVVLTYDTAPNNVNFVDMGDWRFEGTTNTDLFTIDASESEVGVDGDLIVTGAIFYNGGSLGESIALYGSGEEELIVKNFYINQTDNSNFDMVVASKYTGAVHRNFTVQIASFDNATFYRGVGCKTDQSDNEQCSYFNWSSDNAQTFSENFQTKSSLFTLQNGTRFSLGCNLGSQCNLSVGEQFNVTAIPNPSTAFKVDTLNNLILSEVDIFNITNKLYVNDVEITGVATETSWLTASNLIYNDTSTVRVGIANTTPVIYGLQVDNNVSLNKTLFVNTNGRVGIGTVSPSQALDVTGLIRVGTAGDVVSPNANSDELEIQNDASWAGISLLSDTGQILDFGNSSDDNTGRISFTQSTQLMAFSVNGNSERLRLAPGSVVINEVGADADFRVESDTSLDSFFVNAGTGDVDINNTLFVDASAYAVGIGTSSPSQELEVTGAINMTSTPLDIGSTKAITSDVAIRFASTEQFRWDGSDNRFKLTDDLVVDLNLTVNDDFIVDEANADFFVDDSSGKVGIGTSSPQKTLHFVGTDGIVSGGLPTLFTRNDFLLENNHNMFLTLATPNDKIGAIYFSDEDELTEGVFRYDHTSDNMEFLTDGSLALTINSSNDLITVGDLNVGGGDIIGPAGGNLDLDSQFGMDITLGGGPGNDFTIDGTTFYLQSASNTVGIGTNNPNFPLQVVTNVSDGSNLVSIWASSNISATGYITRTSVFDNSKNPADFIRNSSHYLNNDGSVNHSKYYGYVVYPNLDLSRPVNITVEDEFFNITANETQIIYTDVVTYPYNISEEGVMLDMEIDVIRQGLWDLIQRVVKVEADNQAIKDCTASSKDWADYQTCIARI